MSEIDLDELLGGESREPVEEREKLTMRELQRNLYYGDAWPEATWPRSYPSGQRYLVLVVAVFQTTTPGEYDSALVWIEGIDVSHRVETPGGARIWEREVVVATQPHGQRVKQGGLMLVPYKELAFREELVDE